MSSNRRESQLQKDLEANKKRTEAILYLQKQGHNVNNLVTKIPSGVVKPVQPSSADNTLQLLMNERIQNHTNSKASENKAKDQLLKVQSSLKDIKPSLPSNWKEVTDQTTMKVYYWNTVTNETTWEFPKSTESSQTTKLTIANSNLPEGWEEKIHPSTKQVYFFNKLLNKTSFVRPSSSDPNNSTESNSKNLELNCKRERDNQKQEFQAKEQLSKKIRHDVDPLDPSGGKKIEVKDGKFADSTASGPLWQQRPYPKPSEVLNSSKSNSTTSFGPSMKK